MNDRIDPHSEEGVLELNAIALQMFDCSLRQNPDSFTQLMYATFERSEYPGDTAGRLIAAILGTAETLIANACNTADALTWLEQGMSNIQAEQLIEDALRGVNPEA